MRHAYTTAGVRWRVISALAFLLAATRERDTMFLIEHWDNVLMPCAVLTTAWVSTSARTGRAGRRADGTDVAAAPAMDADRLAALKRAFTIKRARAKTEPPSAKPTPGSLSHIMQCPDENFWQGR